MAVHEGRLDFTGVSLRSVNRGCLQTGVLQITAPLWMDTVRFDIAAKIPEGVPKDRAPAMLQTLLKDRFKMKAHVETREGTSYALVAGKANPS